MFSRLTAFLVVLLQSGLRNIGPVFCYRNYFQWELKALVIYSNCNVVTFVYYLHKQADT